MNKEPADRQGGAAMNIGVVVADARPIVLEGLNALISSQPDMRVVARCERGGEALEAIRERRPDIAIVDLALPDQDGLALLRVLREQALPTRCVLFADALNDEQAVEATRLQVEGIVLKDMPTRLLLQCIRKVHDGGRWLETQSMTRVVDRLQRQEAQRSDLLGRLSPRELDVTRHVVAGLNNKDIAEELSLSVGTIKIHLHNIYEKLGIRSRLQLAAYAREKGFG
ncbi:response regulator [Thioalkalivibrio nitratireducens]|nr:response regulator transcription factor [Thioalkalivibrio nitratireducens]